MESEKLYYQDSFLTCFEGRVLSCEKKENKYLIVLDKTAFYPEGGGQPSDTGVLYCEDKTAHISYVKEKEGVIYHTSDTPLEKGSFVKGEINFSRRLDFCQQHSGEHILSGVIHSLYGGDNVGFHLTENDMYIDFSVSLTETQIKTAFEKANEYILKSQEVICSYPDVANMEYRCKKELKGKIRIVDLGTADRCACCGTHVKNTAQVQLLLFEEFQNYKGGVRIYFCAGKRAVQKAQEYADNCKKISVMLSAKKEQILQKVNDKIEENNNLNYRLNQNMQEMFSLWAQNLKGEKIKFIQKDNLDSRQVQQLCAVLNQDGAVSCVYSPQDENTAKICIIDKNADIISLGKQLCAATGAKGGGKNGIFQGNMPLNSEIENIFKGLCNG